MSLAIFQIPYSKFCLKKGFSLFELLIYMAVLSGLMVVVANSFISLSKGRGQTEARYETQASLRFAGERLRQDIKVASVVQTPALGTSSSTLVLTISGVQVTYDVVTGTLRRKEGAASPVAMSGPQVLVSSPLFTVLSNYNSRLGATTTTVQISMMFSYNASSTDWSYSSALKTTATLR